MNLPSDIHSAFVIKSSGPYEFEQKLQAPHDRQSCSEQVLPSRLAVRRLIIRRRNGRVCTEYVPIHPFGYCLDLVLCVAVDRQASIVAPEVVRNHETNCISCGFFVTPIIDSLRLPRPALLDMSDERFSILLSEIDYGASELPRIRAALPLLVSHEGVLISNVSSPSAQICRYGIEHGRGGRLQDHRNTQQEILSVTLLAFMR